MNLRITELRAEFGISQNDLAIKTKLDRSILSRVETNDRKLRVDEAVLIADVFSVKVDYLIGHIARTYEEERRLMLMWQAISGWATIS